MKIIHTSDWHLGQYFMGKSRQAEHRKFLSWLIEQAIEHQVDSLIVAGDIFDTGAPPSYARELYHKFVIDFCKATDNSVPLVFVAGNHDSVAMLEETSALLKHFNTHVVSSADDETIDQQILSVKSKGGNLNGLVCAVPFLRPRDLVSSSSGSSGKEKQRDMQSAIASHYSSLFGKAQSMREQSGLDVPIIMTGHLTVVGAKTSESVRDIYIGTLDAFPASSFPLADYIALGHIHKNQKIKGDCEVHYSGSPIPLSFDELNQDKSVQLVDLNGSNVEVTRLFIPRFQEMYKIKGNLDEIRMEIDNLKGLELGEQGESSESIWIEVEVEEQDYLDDIQKRVEEFVSDTAIEVLCLKRTRNRRNLSLFTGSSERLQELTPEQVFDKRLALEEEGLDDALKDRLSNKFKEALNHVLHEG